MKNRQFMWALAMACMSAFVACGGSNNSNPAGSASPSATLPPFTPSLTTSAQHPLQLFVGETATLSFLPNSTYVLDTWTMSVQYQQVTNDGVLQSPSPTVTPCGAVLPTAPAMGALTFSINATGAPAPCTENVVFVAIPPNQSPAPGASATPAWTTTLYVSVLPSPSPSASP